MLLFQRNHSITDRVLYSEVASHSKAGKEEWSVHLIFWHLRGCSRNSFLSLQSQTTDVAQHTLDTWGEGSRGPGDDKGRWDEDERLLGNCVTSREPAVMQTDTRGSKRL